MPTYDYECEKCGKSFEAFQSMKDKPFETCPENTCGIEEWSHGKVRRLIGTGAGLIFKGSGFYITDYRSDSYKAAAKKDSEGSSSSTTSSTTTSTPAPASPAPAAAKPSTAA